MIDKIRRLAQYLLVALPEGGERELEPLFADLLRDPARAFGEQLRRVAAFRPLGDALRDDALQDREKSEVLGGGARRGLSETGRRALMARRTRAAARGSGACRRRSPP